MDSYIKWVVWSVTVRAVDKPDVVLLSTTGGVFYLLTRRTRSERISVALWPSVAAAAVAVHTMLGHCAGRPGFIHQMNPVIFRSIETIVLILILF